MARLVAPHASRFYRRLPRRSFAGSGSAPRLDCGFCDAGRSATLGCRPHAASARTRLKLPARAPDNTSAEGLALQRVERPLIRRSQHRLTYANVVSSLALFVALGGASYAAFRLPPNSVGTRQLKDHAVTLVKIDTSVRRGIRQSPGPPGPGGPRGSTGPVGPQGPPGTARAFGEIDARGNLSASRGIGNVTHPLAGRYCITVPGLNPSTETIGVTLNVASARDAAPPTERAGDGNVCPVGTWEVATGILHTLSVAGPVQFTDSDEPFSVIVP